MINKIKETLNQIFFSPEASGTWEKNTEQTIDELEAPPFECGPGHLTQGYGFFGHTGVPAPAYLKDDEWFGPAPVSEKGQDYMEKETEIKQQEEENRQYWTKEPENIHQVMYEIATKSGATTIQLDPIGGSENFQGGSENVHR
jgi:hypothetical protein|tara:strand:- start:163 stop:591 length:429 start_codon:yes stop_codon:yes gene_type:complete